ncbi:alpha-L-arabinofuranosidase C-terminal domain-containing protein [Terriglobus tenax]|uniref:alpha-L-arabinofuranosidase C-terminal domain-containing protein n=1 Tax=Terriglobus tenax TaxID=1111115 RepID=UPI0021DF45AA|nr:alpha-L-arabinofuranosidase C-terminal domain-containing protein [Terriglobus tenax]
MLEDSRPDEPRVAVLLVDMDRASQTIDPYIYGQFLEHINHSVEDGLFAEQIRGAGFEGKDFETYWKPDFDRGQVEVANLEFQNGSKSLRLKVNGGHAKIQQGRLFLEDGVAYDGFLWVKRERGTPRLTIQVHSSSGQILASVLIAVPLGDWHRIPFTFRSNIRDTEATLELAASGHGSLLVDFVSMMRSDVRRDGMFRPDLFEALEGLRPTFIRWPGGSFASTYRWKEGIGPYESRGYHPNTYWGGYSDYFGFGTDEFLNLCKKLNAEPLITLAAPDTSPEAIEYALDWIRYVNDPPMTEWGQRRAANGHPEPYNVRYFQIDNEPMNNGFTAQSYAEVVNAYGPRLRAASPGIKIVACGQKRSNDMEWSQTVIDLAGANFDVLGCHNYEYEPANFELGVRRIHDYLAKLCDYVRASKHPKIEVAVLEWSLQHTYDWRAGLHAAGSLMMYEELSPGLTMTCPALLMRNTTDDPSWTAAIYHDHVSWFPGGSYPVSKLFREHYAEELLASATGTFRDRDRTLLLDKISTAIPQGWQPGSVDANATRSKDGKRIVIKAVNYQGQRNSILVRLQGAAAPQTAAAMLHTLGADLMDVASLEHPDRFAVSSRNLEYSKTFSIDLEPYSVAVVEIRPT